MAHLAKELFERQKYPAGDRRVGKLWITAVTPNGHRPFPSANGVDVAAVLAPQPGRAAKHALELVARLITT